MSHFLVTVILPKDCKTLADVEETVADLLEPYNENMEVEEYERDCYCIGLQAQREVREAVAKEFGSIDSLRDYYWNELPEDQRNDAKWQELVAPRKKMEEELLAVHPLKNSPNPDCEECHGTGHHPSTYNPDSKWDWYVIGGRWDGWIFGPDRQKQSEDGEGGFNFGDKHHTIENNRRKVKDLLADIEAEKMHTPFTVVLPDGSWHEKGEMGWWGMVANETDQDDWDHHVTHLFTKFERHFAVTVDCHI